MPCGATKTEVAGVAAFILRLAARPLCTGAGMGWLQQVYHPFIQQILTEYLQCTRCNAGFAKLHKIKREESFLSPWERGRHVDREGHESCQVSPRGCPQEAAVLPGAGGR